VIVHPKEILAADPSGRARFKAWVCGFSLAGTAGSNPAMGMVVSLVVSGVFSGRGLCEG